MNKPMSVLESADNTPLKLDFSNTEIAFASKSNRELEKAIWLFRMMNKGWLVKLGGAVTKAAVKLRIPGVIPALRVTIYEHFCGGETLLECQDQIDHLMRFKTHTILDYGAEGKETEQDFNITMNETIRAIEFAATNTHVPVVSSKISGLARFALLEKLNDNQALNEAEKGAFTNVLKRLDSMCHVAAEKGVSIFFDAEETWIQNALDRLVMRMMERYNTDRPVVYNTFQMYRHDRLAYLNHSYNLAQKGGFILGAKLVRGAYMEKERSRAEEHGYPSPIQPNKAATDADYNTALQFCLANYEQIAVCNASHNQQSARIMAETIVKKNLPKKHPHLWFSQLLGMSDNLTFNLANAGFNVAKYVPYGPVRDVVPYLIRRAEENTAVTADVSRELQFFLEEKKRRKEEN